MIIEHKNRKEQELNQTIAELLERVAQAEAKVQLAQASQEKAMLRETGE
jgi:hypothetical protein